MLKTLTLILGLTFSLTQISEAMDFYNTPLGKLQAIEDFNVEDLEGLFTKSLANEYELAAAVKTYAPWEFMDLIHAMLVSYGYDETINEVTTRMLPIVDSLWRDHLIFADDQSLLMYGQLMQLLLQTTQNNPSDCLALLMGNTRVMEKVALETDGLTKDKLHAMYARVLQTSDVRRELLPEEKRISKLTSALTPVMDQYGRDILFALEPPTQLADARYCVIMSDVYRYLNALPERDAAEIMRLLIIQSTNH